ncbi:uncharacterized protein VNE69_01131 [Vairimorpha necatrix]|uniref:Uncharacterized protein n=1 Tax=Vairimorpha necatrix TaxID=6039 RepID=A0AAX4J8A5_9MICR
MSDLDTRVINVIKKSTLFSTIQSLIEDDIISEIAVNIEDILKSSTGSFSEKQEDVSDFILDFLEEREIEIDENEADSFANILVWIYEEYKVQDNVMYNKIMKIKSPEVTMSDSESETVEQ